jgi:hypothetical protein
MKARKEFVAGVVFILFVVVMAWSVGGSSGLIRTGVTILVASIALFFLSSIRSIPKILNPELLVRLLMPRKYRDAIQELEKTEKRD